MKLSTRFLSLIYPFILISIMACSSSVSVQDTALEAFKKGNQSMKSGAYRAAIQEYNFAIEQDNTQAAFYYNKGLAEFELKIFKDAELSFKESVKLDKNLAEAWHNLALVYERTGDSEKAYIAYERYQKILNK